MQGILKPLSLVFLSTGCLSAFANTLLPDVELGARTRWETAKFEEDKAHAFTIKARASITYPLTETLNSFLQVDHVASFKEDDHSNGVLDNGKPVIADPQGTEINQVKITKHWDETQLNIGRQHIAYGDERFIGGVGFRQNDQTYDAIQIQHKTLSNTTINFAYVHNVNRIFGDDADSTLDENDVRYESMNGVRPKGLLGNHHIDGFLLHANFKEWDYFELDLYGYDVHNYHISAFSNRTAGFETGYHQKFGKAKVEAGIEFAMQEQQSTDADWMHYRKLSAAITMHGLTLGVRHEFLSEDSGTAFITPLATLHRFQGWADQFITTPTVGLRDDSVNLKWKARPFTVDARYHWFKSDAANFDIGEELDVDLIYQPTRKHEVKIRYADFNHDPGQTLKPKDARKLFLMYSYNI